MKVRAYRFILLLFFFFSYTYTHGQEKSGRLVLPLSGSGWSLWLDKKAAWSDDSLYLPSQIASLAALSVNPPTGGWQVLQKAPSVKVNVPGTVEEYLTVSDLPRNTDFSGVSWWYREITVPAHITAKRYILRFESVRMRSEVYIDGKLIAYDLVGESPFDADISEVLKPGKKQMLAVRVTTPGGNFHWQDFNILNWGKYELPPGRAFSGIIGRVELIAVNQTYISDIYMQNTPQMRKVDAVITVTNKSSHSITRNLDLSIVEKKAQGKRLLHKSLKNVRLKSGDNELLVEIDAPDAKLWDLDNPNLYLNQVTLKDGEKNIDTENKVFGFRWFAPEGFGKEAVFRLNGKRIVLRTAISWGYWPVTGLIATPEMARKQVLTAKQLGLNMLSFHRSIGSPVVLEAADELGLLYYEEPGGFQAVGKGIFIRNIMLEKIVRMAKRDRSHPSLVIYNMINEYGGKYNKDSALLASRFRDMQELHKTDPSRTVTFTSGWASRKDASEIAKAHFRPFDRNLHKTGWFDNHRAGGPETWKEIYYTSPSDNLMFTDNNSEIYMRGEEGALSTPPALEKINASLKQGQAPGWDGRFWKKQFEAFEQMLDSKKLRVYFPSVDFLTRTLGDISYEHQGRRIQGMRMQNVGDCYAINGWESMPYDNHSGVVDTHRNPKGSPDILAYYNQSHYIAVVPRQQVVRLPTDIGVDFYAVNETGIHGKHTLRIVVESAENKIVFDEERPVNLIGGEKFGQLLLENLKVSLPAIPGIFKVKASLLNSRGIEQAAGKDEVLGVSWNSSSLKGAGAIYRYAEKGKVDDFFKRETNKDLASFELTKGPLDWIAVTRPPLDAPSTIGQTAFQTPDGRPGIQATFFHDNDIREKAGTRIDSKVDFTFIEGAQPDQSLSANQPFSAIWEGKLLAPVSGQYLIGLTLDGGLRLTINGDRIIDDWGNFKRVSLTRAIMLEKGKAADIRVEYRQQKKSGSLQLQWSLPGQTAINPQLIIDRVKNDATTLVLLEASDAWMDIIARNTNVRSHGSFVVDKNWVGGVHFVKDHPLFHGLPVNCGMNWPYQAVVSDGQRRIALRLENEELVVGAYRSYPFDLGTSVAVIPCGKGNIVISTLNIVDNLTDPSGPSEVARNLFFNFLNYKDLLQERK